MKTEKGTQDLAAETLTLAAAGQMAGGVAEELATPLREVRENLAIIIEMLDRHILDSGGPLPYPWESLKSLRERVAQSYLASRRVARLTADLANAITTFDKRPETVDVNKLVEIAISLTRHRIAADTEVFVDLARLPATRLVPGALILALAQLIAVAADSARSVPGAAVSVKTRLDEGVSQERTVAIYIADSGRGMPTAAAAAIVASRHVADELGGTFEGASQEGTGSVFELKIPVMNRSSSRTTGSHAGHNG